MKRLIFTLTLSMLGGISFSPAEASEPGPPNSLPLQAGEREAILVRARDGETGAQIAMIAIDTDWVGEKPDYVDALYWYDKLATGKSHSGALDYRFSSAHRLGAAELRRFNSEHSALYAKAREGDPQALYDFAWHTPHMASGINGDAPLAHWLLLAAGAGNRKAQAQIGYLYLQAFFERRAGTGPDIDASRELIKPEYLEDFTATSRVRLPLGFEDESLDTDSRNAIVWLGKAADAGDIRARYNLGLAYATSGPSRDMTSASHALHQSLFLAPSLPVTACDLDMTGRVVAGDEREAGADPDPKAAFQCYDRVKGEHPGAYFVLGYMYHHGIGVKRDDRQAIVMLEEAERHSDWRPGALYELSLIYRDSLTVRHNLGKAVVLLAEAQAAPITPRTICGKVQYADDPGGPMALDAHNSGTSNELNAAYLALPDAQRSAVDKELEEQGISMPSMDTAIEPRIPYDQCF